MINITQIGQLLKTLRGKRSLREIERSSGVSHTYISSIEKGVDPRSGNEIIPTPDTLKKLSRAYNYSYGELMDIAGYLEGVSEDKKKRLKDRYEELELLDNTIYEILLKMISLNGSIIEEFKPGLIKIIEETDLLDLNEVNFDSTKAIEQVYNAISDFDSANWKAETLVELNRMITNYQERTDLNTILMRPNIFYKDQPITQKHKQLLISYLNVLFQEENS